MSWVIVVIMVGRWQWLDNKMKARLGYELAANLVYKYRVS